MGCRRLPVAALVPTERFSVPLHSRHGGDPQNPTIRSLWRAWWPRPANGRDRQRAATVEFHPRATTPSVAPQLDYHVVKTCSSNVLAGGTLFGVVR